MHEHVDNIIASHPCQGLVKASRNCMLALKPLTHGFDAYQVDHADRKLPAEAAEVDEDEAMLPKLTMWLLKISGGSVRFVWICKYMA